MEEFNPKKDNIPYTIGILKPDLVFQEEKVHILLTISYISTGPTSIGENRNQWILYYSYA